MAQVLQSSPAAEALQSAPLREVHGRKFNTMNTMYNLPADAPEHARLGLQHEALFLAVEGLYQARDDVQKALAIREDGLKPAILDIGTGSGIWAISMAKEFPHCDVVGIDLAPVSSALDIPVNCRFECRDANHGFSDFYNSFDVVHARSLGTGVNDRDALFQEIKSMLRPGGVFLFVEGDLHIYSETFEQLPWCEPGEPGFSWVQKAFATTFKALEARGLPISQINRPPRDALIRMEKIPEFENPGASTVYIPMGAWPSDPKEAYIGEVMGKDAAQVVKAMRPLMLQNSVSPALIDEVIRNAEQEIQSLSVQTYSAWYYSWARKVVTSK
ncbi:S-adenosyl-L-methionine-dependent methyltransferase [Exidia glandulosa HHB12029]|uniref:S-adenosyl-L-methionine-dependent methyltransferase n=1 Tax=Exidia glandulosa HHB12029 TaxID=1314781 RepID=A0A165IHK0_EXIGL|nr:S-adenosyl-L-methionine-dependent methyltransferase [Exidia glandulosa HHB12029]